MKALLKNLSATLLILVGKYVDSALTTGTLLVTVDIQDEQHETHMLLNMCGPIHVYRHPAHCKESSMCVSICASSQQLVSGLRGNTPV